MELMHFEYHRYFQEMIKLKVVFVIFFGMECLCVFVCVEEVLFPRTYPGSGGMPTVTRRSLHTFTVSSQRAIDHCGRCRQLRVATGRQKYEKATERDGLRGVGI